jgi:hypothetical protein
MPNMKNVFTTHLVKKTSIVCALLTVTACASGPRSVNASLPLVTASMEMPNKKVVPSQYWSILSDQNQTELIHTQYKIGIAETYSSALGLSCRKLSIEDINIEAKNSEIKKRVVCENHFINDKKQPSKGWFFEKTIIESSSYVEL